MPYINGTGSAQPLAPRTTRAASYPKGNNTMATKTTRKPATRKPASPVPAPAPVQAPAAPVVAPAPVQAAVPAATVVAGPKQGTQLLAVAHFGGAVPAARNVLARASSLCAPVPAALQGVLLQAGRPCRVRVPYTQAAHAACVAALAAAGGKAPAATLAAASTTDFVRYAVRRGWLEVAPA